MSEADAQKLQAIHYWFGMAHECLASAYRAVEHYHLHRQTIVPRLTENPT